MNTAWTTAFVVLSGLVLCLGVLVIGLMRRLAPVLDRLEGSAGAEVGLVREGLDAGRIVGDFDALTATGQRIARDDIKCGSAPCLFVFLEPGCDYCETVMAGLIETLWPAELPDLYLVLSDSPESRARRLESTGATVLYQADAAVSRAFGTNITPVAFLIDTDGTVLTRRVPQAVGDLVAITCGHSNRPRQLPMAFESR